MSLVFESGHPEGKCSITPVARVRLDLWLCVSRTGVAIFYEVCGYWFPRTGVAIFYEVCGYWFSRTGVAIFYYVSWLWVF